MSPQGTTSDLIEPPLPVLVGRAEDWAGPRVRPPGPWMVLLSILLGGFGLLLGIEAERWLNYPPPSLLPRLLLLALGLVVWGVPSMTWLSLVLHQAADVRQKGGRVPWQYRLLLGVRLILGGGFVLGLTLFGLLPVFTLFIAGFF